MMEFLLGAMTGSFFTAILAIWIEQARIAERNERSKREHDERMSRLRGGIV